MVTANKSTILRRTNQCILIVAVNEGKKEVFPVGAPLVYRATADQHDQHNSDVAEDDSKYKGEPGMTGEEAEQLMQLS